MRRKQCGDRLSKSMTDSTTKLFTQCGWIFETVTYDTKGTFLQDCLVILTIPHYEKI